MTWTLPLAGGRAWSINRTQVIGILNATPDSFSDGGQLSNSAAVIGRVRAMQAQGVDAFDVGGESTRPGHTPVQAEDEIKRVVPAIEAIRAEAPDAIISIDTQKAVVASAALAAGADWINDVSGLSDPKMGAVVREAGCAVVLMRHEPLVGPAVEACKLQLAGLVERARAQGISDDAIVLDPGLGFGDPPGPSVSDNLALLDGIHSYAESFPVMIGHSRKRFVAAIAAENNQELDETTADLCIRARQAGAAMVRVHDVGSAVQALA